MTAVRELSAHPDTGKLVLSLIEFEESRNVFRRHRLLTSDSRAVSPRARADKGKMSSTLDPRLAPRLFVRGDASVRTDAKRLGTGFQLENCGPGRQRRTLPAADLAMLIEHRSQFEDALVRKGFTLTPGNGERRKIPR